jgi:hypothetical protein
LFARFAFLRAVRAFAIHGPAQRLAYKQDRPKDLPPVEVSPLGLGQRSMALLNSFALHRQLSQNQKADFGG